MDLPRVFHGGTELKSYFCIFQRGLEPRARLDVIFALRQGVKEVAVDKTGTIDRTGTIRFLEVKCLRRRSPNPSVPARILEFHAATHIPCAVVVVTMLVGC